MWACLVLQQVLVCLRVIGIVSGSIVKQHRMFTAKADELHENWDQWKGPASLCQIADRIYSTLQTLEKEPQKFLDRDEMMGIFDEWRVIPEVEEWWQHSFVQGYKSNSLGCTKKEDQFFPMERVLPMLFEGAGDLNL